MGRTTRPGSLGLSFRRASKTSCRNDREPKAVRTNRFALVVLAFTDERFINGHPGEGRRWASRDPHHGVKAQVRDRFPRATFRVVAFPPLAACGFVPADFDIKQIRKSPKN